MTSRRDLLKGGLTAAGLASVAGLLPESVKRAYAITPDPGTTFLDAEHVVIFMQENRSFDHLFGTMRGVRGFRDPHPVAQSDGSPVFLQRGKTGDAHAPWRLHMTESRATWLGDLPHGRDDQVDAWNGGAHNNWIDAKQHRKHADIPLTMGYHTREDVPFYYALADAFTVCDQYYCSVMSSTTPNRMMMWSGTIREPNEHGSLVYMRNPQTHPTGLTWTSFPERLEKAGIDWKIYQNDIWTETQLSGEAFNWLSNSGDNMIERFKNIPVNFTPSYLEYANGIIDRMLVNIHERQTELQAELARHAAGTPKHAEIAGWLRSYEAQIKRLERKRTAGVNDLSRLTDAQKSLRARALPTNSEDPDWHTLDRIDFTVDGKAASSAVPKGDLFHRFRADVRADKLPTVSWLVAPPNFCAHPSKPLFADWYVSEIMDILTENPAVWKKCIFILTFDENDGYFDHAPSFVAADPNRPETGGATPGIDVGEEYTWAEDERIQGVSAAQSRTGPIGLGYRVPTIIASPWTRGGWVNSEVSDHTSIIRFLEKFIAGKFGRKLVDDNISDWRRTVCGDLTSCFRTFDGKPVDLPKVDQHEHIRKIVAASAQPLPSGHRTFGDTAIKAVIREPASMAEILWQEPGVKPSCALPYELQADAEIDFVSGQLVIHLAAGDRQFGDRSAGAPFNIYRYGTRESTDRFPVPGLSGNMQAGTWVVAAGQTLAPAYPLGDIGGEHYDIAVHAPNGFYRRFRGGRKVPGLRVRSSCRVGANGEARMILDIANISDREVDLRAQSSRYLHWNRKLLIPAHTSASLEVPTRRNENWYDFSLQSAGDTAFLWKYAGRMETGRACISDPALSMDFSG